VGTLDASKVVSREAFGISGPGDSKGCFSTLLFRFLLGTVLLDTVAAFNPAIVSLFG